MIGSSRGAGAGLPAINHSEAEALISARLDVALDPRQEQILNAHLATCPRCRQFAAQMEAMRTGLRELPRLPASPIVSRQVRERIAQPPTVMDRVAGLFGGRLGVAPVAATAAFLILVIGGYALFGDDPEGGRLGPTISAGTQIADQSSTNTAPAVTEAATRTPIQPGEVIPTETPAEIPNVRFVEETPTATEEPTETPAPTETETVEPSATDVPTEEPTSTSEPTDPPTDTPEPTATETPTEEPTSTEEPTEEPTETPEPTATETATQEPTATETEVPTEEPTATEEPTEELTPTDEPTEEPTATEEPTEEPTATEEPTEEPTATEEPDLGPPTIAPADQTPVEEITEEPGDELAPPEPTEDAGEDTTQIVPMDATEEIPVDATEVGEPTVEGDEPEGSGEDAEGPLDNTRRITAITSGGAPTGPLRVNAPASLMVLSADAGGGSLQVVSMSDGTVFAELGAAAYPIWSPMGIMLLYQDLNNGVPAAALYDGDSGDLYPISNPADAGAAADIPAGWAGSSAYYLRVMGDEAATIILYGYDVNTGETAEVWRSEGVSLTGGRPIPTGSGFLIATAASWLLVGADGSESNLGTAEFGLAGEGFLSPDASLVAYPIGGDLVIAETGSPGIPLGFIPYAGGPGAGFSWSPDGSSVVVSDGVALTIYDTSGTPLGVADSLQGVAIAAPQWLTDGIYYVELSPTPSLRRILVGNIPGFGG